MLYVIKHAVVLSLSFSITVHQRTAHGSCSTVQLLQCKTPSFLQLWPQHYCKISTDPKYVAPLLKLTVGNSDEKYIDEYKIFGVLDTLRPTATGLDGLPAWFLRTGAPIFCQPLTHLLNLSLSTSTVPRQWKQAWIRPVATVAVPTQHADFRPISITPVLTRIMERTVVQSYILSYTATASMPHF